MSSHENEIQKLYIAYFNRPADVAGLAFWEAQVARTGSLAAVANAFSASAEYRALYQGKTSAEIVDAIYLNLLGRHAEPAGLAYWGARLDANIFDIGNIVTAIMSGAQNADRLTVDNKVAAARQFTAAMDTPAEIAAYSTSAAVALARAWLATVNDNPASLTAAMGSMNNAISAIVASAVPAAPTDPGPPAGPQTFTPTAGADTFTGTAYDDTFVAGAGTLNAGDVFNGGGGFDVLRITASGQTLAGTLTSIEEIRLVDGGTLNALASALGTVAFGHAATTDAGDVTLAIDTGASTSFDLSGVTAGQAGTGTSGIKATYTNVGTAALNVTLSGLADTFAGTAQADTIRGGAGDDVFVGFEGQDTLDGGTGTNTLRLTATSADLNGAANAQLLNVSRVDASSAGAGVTVDLSAQGEAFTVTGSAFADTLRGGTGNDVLNGGDGDDTLRTTSGADTIDGGNGTDTLFVQAGAADLTGYTLSSIETLDLNAQATTLSRAQHAGFNTFTNSGAGGVTFSDAGAVTAATAGLSRYTLANGANTFTANGAQNYNVSGAAASAKQTFNFAGANLSSSDTIVGGSGTDDVLNITGNTGFTGFVLDGVNKVESIVFDNTTASISLNRAGSSALTSTSGVVTIDASSMTTGNFTFSDNASTSQAFKFLLGGTGNATITISGNESVTIVGGAGSGVFTTNAATDSITGGTGNDTVRGGVGADLIDLSRGGNDVWRFVLADGGDTVNGFTAGTGANQDTIDWNGELKSNNGQAVNLAGFGATSSIAASNFLVLDGAASAGGFLTIANATGYAAGTSTVLVVHSSVATLSGHTATAFRNVFGAGGTHALTAGANDDSKFLVMVYDGTTASANAVLFHVDFTAATNGTSTLEAGDTVTLLGVLNGVGADTLVAGNFV